MRRDRRELYRAFLGKLTTTLESDDFKHTGKHSGYFVRPRDAEWTDSLGLPTWDRDESVIIQPIIGVRNNALEELHCVLLGEEGIGSRKHPTPSATTALNLLLDKSDRDAWHFRDELEAVKMAEHLRNQLNTFGTGFFSTFQDLDDLIAYYAKCELDAKRAPESLARAVTDMKRDFPNLNFTAHFKNYRSFGGFGSWGWESHLPCALYLSGRLDASRDFLDEFTQHFPQNPVANGYHARYLEFARRLRERLEKANLVR